jgi:2-polyprenyl-3-methyl-5-hydroxy-6-metoxy-1,4-benzoquinol methylase
MTTSWGYPVGLADFVEPETAWPESWKLSHRYDELEIWGSLDNPGYTNKYRLRFLEALDLVKRSVPDGASVLDLAAAQGNFTIALSQSGYRVTWNDLRSELADYVVLKARGLPINYLSGNIFDLNLQTRFDAVLAAEIIEHVAHPDEFLSKLAGLIVPNGVIILTTPNGDYFRNTLPTFSECADPSIFESKQFRPDADGHIFLYNVTEIAKLANKCHLSLEEIRVFCNPLSGGTLRTGKLLGVLPPAVTMKAEALTRRLPERPSRKIHTHLAVILRTSG